MLGKLFLFWGSYNILPVIGERKYSKLETVREKEYNRLHTILLTVHIVDKTKTIRGKKYSNLIDNTILLYRLLETGSIVICQITQC